MYAIVRTGGKQYRVEEGRTLSVELLPAKEGSSVELKDVLLIADDGEVTVGTPIIDGARVLADVEAHDRAKKIIVFKYKAKVRTRKKTGHRQHLTRLAVTEILRPGQESKVAKPKRRRAKKAASAEAGAEADASAKTPAEATKEKPAPKRRTRKPALAKATSATAAATDDKPAPKRRARKAPAKAKTPSAARTGAPEKAAPKRRTRKAATPKTASAKAGAEAETKDEKAAADAAGAEAKASAKPARKRTSRAKGSTASTSKKAEDKE